MTKSLLAFRSDMPVSRNYTYLDHAAVAPLSLPAQEAITELAAQAATAGDIHWPKWAAQVEELRGQVSSLIDCETDEIALISNTTTGINFVAQGFPWKSGDNVITVANEFPSNLYPWMQLQSEGVEVRTFDPMDQRVGVDDLLNLCDEKTRMIAVSWVSYASGWRIDLEGLVSAAHERGIYIFLDAIQGLGVFPLSLQKIPVDFLSADGHKWLLGPEGAGLFYVKKEHLNLLRPMNVGWNSVVNPYAFDQIDLTYRDAASRYEGGSQNMQGMAGLAGSIRLLMKAGLNHEDSEIATHVLHLNGVATEGLNRLGASIISPMDEEPHRSGILTFQFTGANHEELRNHCLRAKVVLSCRGGGLRISPHGYNQESDMEKLLDTLKDGLKSQDWGK